MVFPLKHAFGIAFFTSFLFIVPDGHAINSYCLLIVFGRLLVRKYSSQSTIKFDKISFLFLALLAIGLLSALVFRGKDSPEYLKRTFITIVTVISFVNIYKNNNDFDLFIKYNLLGVFLIALHIYTQVVIPINPFAEAHVTIQGRFEPSGMSGQYINPNLWMFYLLSAFATISSYLILFKRRISLEDRVKSRHYVYLFVFLIFVVGPLVGLLASRSALVVFILVVLICTFKLNFYKSFVLSLTFGLLYLIFNLGLRDQLLVYAETLPESNLMKPLAKRYIDTLQEGEGMEVESRGSLLEIGVRIFRDHPLFGVGFGNEKATFALPQYYGSPKVAHNTAISIMLELGLVGIIFVVALIRPWFKYIELPFIWCVLVVLVSYSMVHGLMLLTQPWLMLCFFHQLLRYCHLKHVNFELLR